MPGLFQNYRVALLDSSFFTAPFTEEVRNGLEDVNIYVAETFNAEIEAYRALLAPGKSAAYNANIEFLGRAKPLKTLDLASFGDQSRNLHNDVWGLLTLLVGLKARFVLITADQLLIQRVVLHNLNVDIYDLAGNRFLYYGEFPFYQTRFALREDAGQAVSGGQEYHAAPKTTLYRRNGSPVVMGKEIKSGLEATLFFVEGRPDLIAKVFKKDRLPAEKFRNILKLQGINRQLDAPWALFPIEALYYDANAAVPAGFTESYARTTGDLSENPLYLGDVEGLTEECLKTRVSASVELCLKVVRQVRYLNSYGFLVSDFNMGNFALSAASADCIQMWDTDSFGYDTFFSGYCAGNRTGREYDITKKQGAVDFCSEALYLFVFSVLSLGDPPISDYSGKFKFDNPDYVGLYGKEFFPPSLWSLFEEVFRGQKEASVGVLLLRLHTVLEQYRRDPASDPTYQELLGDLMEADPADSDRATGGGTTGGGNNAGGTTGGGNNAGWTTGGGNSAGWTTGGGNSAGWTTGGGTSGGTAGGKDKKMPGWLTWLLVGIAAAVILCLTTQM